MKVNNIDAMSIKILLQRQGAGDKTATSTPLDSESLRSARNIDFWRCTIKNIERYTYPGCCQYLRVTQRRLAKSAKIYCNTLNDVKLPQHTTTLRKLFATR